MVDRVLIFAVKIYIFFFILISSQFCFAQERLVLNRDLRIATIESDSNEWIFRYNPNNGRYEDTFSDDLTIILDTFSLVTVIYNKEIIPNKQFEEGKIDLEKVELWAGLRYSGEVMVDSLPQELKEQDIDIILGYPFLFHGQLIVNLDTITFQFTDQELNQELIFPPVLEAFWNENSVYFFLDTGFQGFALMSSKNDFTNFNTSRLLPLHFKTSFTFPYFDRPRNYTDSFLILAEISGIFGQIDSFPIIIQSDFSPIARDGIMLGTGFISNMQGVIDFKNNRLTISEFPPGKILNLHSSGFILSGSDVVNFGKHMLPIFQGKTEPKIDIEAFLNMNKLIIHFLDAESVQAIRGK